MRLIPIEETKENMIVGQTIYGVNGDILINYGNKITIRQINKLKELSWKYVYVDDEYSKDVEIKCTISTEVRNKSIQFIKALYLTIQKATKEEILINEYSKALHNQMQSCLGSIDTILDDIITENISIIGKYLKTPFMSVCLY